MERESFASDESRSGAPKIVIPSVGRYLRRTRSSSEARMTAFSSILIGIGFFLPYVTIAALTNFNPRQSSASERLWTMSWLIVGQIAGIFGAFALRGVHTCAGRLILFLPGLVFVLPAIGGLITVATMFKEFGQCVQL